MKRKCFHGIAVHADRVSPKEATLVGVWLDRQISANQRQEIMGLTPSYQGRGHIGVRKNRLGRTSILYLLRVPDSRAARDAAKALVRDVARITGATSILRKLPNYRAVRRALVS